MSGAVQASGRAIVPDLTALRGYDGIVFDCDGVLLDSNRLKIDAFRDAVLALDFSVTTADAFSQYQATHFGTSRHRLFDMLLEGRFGPVPEVGKQALLDGYAGRIARGYVTVPEAADLGTVLSALHGQAPLYIVSGSDESELRHVCAQRGIDRWFTAIYGSPANKVENLRRVRAEIASERGRAERLIFFGDAEADVDAARAENVEFVFVSRFSTVYDRMAERAADENFATIETLDALTQMVGEVAS